MWPLPACLASVALGFWTVARLAFVRIMHPVPSCPRADVLFCMRACLPWGAPSFPVKPEGQTPGKSSLNVDPKQSQISPEITRMTLEHLPPLYYFSDLHNVLCNVCLLLT